MASQVSNALGVEKKDVFGYLAEEISQEVWTEVNGHTFFETDQERDFLKSKIDMIVRRLCTCASQKRDRKLVENTIFVSDIGINNNDVQKFVKNVIMDSGDVRKDDILIERCVEVKAKASNEAETRAQAKRPKTFKVDLAPKHIKFVRRAPGSGNTYKEGVSLTQKLFSNLKSYTGKQISSKKNTPTVAHRVPRYAMGLRRSLITVANKIRGDQKGILKTKVTFIKKKNLPILLVKKKGSQDAFVDISDLREGSQLGISQERLKEIEDLYSNVNYIVTEAF